MTIEIHQPELEALILDRMKSGAFHNIEDVLMQALKSSQLPAVRDNGLLDKTRALTGADLVAAMQASPYKEIDLETSGVRLPVREVVL